MKEIKFDLADIINKELDMLLYRELYIESDDELTSETYRVLRYELNLELRNKLKTI
jgi:hypothetical protein